MVSRVVRLTCVDYPDTNVDTLLPNLAKVAKQLSQPLPPIRFGEPVRECAGGFGWAR